MQFKVGTWKTVGGHQAFVTAAWNGSGVDTPDYVFLGGFCVKEDNSTQAVVWHRDGRALTLLAPPASPSNDRRQYNLSVGWIAGHNPDGLDEEQISQGLTNPVVRLPTWAQLAMVPPNAYHRMLEVWGRESEMWYPAKSLDGNRTYRFRYDCTPLVISDDQPACTATDAIEAIQGQPGGTVHYVKPAIRQPPVLWLRVHPDHTDPAMVRRVACQVTNVFIDDGRGSIAEMYNPIDNTWMEPSDSPKFQWSNDLINWHLFTAPIPITKV